MPVFQLTEKIIFPHPDLAEETGLLAVGGDLSVPRLIAAYRLGIFPWYSDNDPILWWFTSPRLVLFPAELRVTKRLNRYYKNSVLRMTINQAFDKVIMSCAATRRARDEGTWITQDMLQAYKKLHRKRYAHSVECWHGDSLVGGLYGIALGRVFFGESMFTSVTDGSKIALVGLVELLKNKGVELIDCQMTTQHLLRFGAREIEGKEFQKKLAQLIQSTTPDGKWTNE